MQNIITKEINKKLKILTVVIFVALMLLTPKHVAAQDYSCGTYGTGDYSSTDASSDCDDNLDNTGEDAKWELVIGGVFLVAGVIVFVIPYKKSRQNK